MREDRPICPAVVPDEERRTIWRLLGEWAMAATLGVVGFLAVFGAMLAIMLVFGAMTGGEPW